MGTTLYLCVCYANETLCLTRPAPSAHWAKGVWFDDGNYELEVERVVVSRDGSIDVYLCDLLKLNFTLNESVLNAYMSIGWAIDDYDDVVRELNNHSPSQSPTTKRSSPPNTHDGIGGGMWFCRRSEHL